MKSSASTVEEIRLGEQGSGPGGTSLRAASLPAIRLLSLRITLRPCEPLFFGRAEVGAVLRGAFGETMKRLVCAFDWSRTPCRGCALRERCPYPQVFEPEAPEGAPLAHQDPRRPYVMKPPVAGEKTYGAGEALSFGLVLFSERVAKLVPFFIVTWREIAEKGIGLRRSRLRLERVESRNDIRGLSQELYEAGTGLVRMPQVEVTGADLIARAEQMPADRARVRFLTPALLKHEGNFVEHPPFHVLVRRLRDRVNALAATFGPGPLDLDWAGLAERAAKVRTERCDTRWVRAERRSSRTGASQALGGCVGEAVYVGDMREFGPLLSAGELLHVGKDAVFGNGWIRVEGAER